MKLKICTLIGGQHGTPLLVRSQQYSRWSNMNQDKFIKWWWTVIGIIAIIKFVFF